MKALAPIWYTAWGLLVGREGFVGILHGEAGLDELVDAMAADRLAVLGLYFLP